MDDFRTLIVGLGNPVLGDDGVGWAVLEALEAARDRRPAGIELDRLAVGGLTLMERLTGFDRAILIDALVTRRDPPGTVSVFPLAALDGRPAAHLDSAHDAPLGVALAAGRALGARVPAEITVVGIEALGVDTFSEVLSPAVEAAVPAAMDRVLRLLEAGDAGSVIAPPAPAAPGHAPAAR